jgi:hypothetical protein
MKFTYLTLIALCLFACGERNIDSSEDHITNHISDPMMGEHYVKSLSEPTKTTNSNKVTLDLSDNLVDVYMYGDEVKTIDLPTMIKVPLKMRCFERIALVPNIDSLKTTCQEMFYKTQKYQTVTGIRAKAYLNPFTNEDFKVALYREVFLTSLSQIPGSFDAITSDIIIIAPYLTDREKAQLKLWLGPQIKDKHQLFSFTAVGSLDELKPPEDPTMELGRLICGILEGEAYLDVVLTDKDGRTLTTRIDRVEFSID